MVLARRPDVAAAEQGLQAARARVGAAGNLWAPVFSLTAGGGQASVELGDLIKTAARSWTLGALLSLPLFDGGRREARLDAAQADLQLAAVQYREQVLVALREVDDQLSALRWLGEQAGALQATQDDADRAAALAQSRYERGLTSQLEVLEARTAAQRHRHAALQVQAARQQATVALVRALGGGWGDAPPPVAMRGSDGRTVRPHHPLAGRGLAASGVRGVAHRLRRAAGLGRVVLRQSRHRGRGLAQGAARSQQCTHALSAQLAGRLATSTLAIGRAVKAGEVLAELDASGPQLRLREEQARLQALPPRVASLEQEMASVQAVLAADQRAAAAALQAGAGPRSSRPAPKPVSPKTTHAGCVPRSAAAAWPRSTRRAPPPKRASRVPRAKRCRPTCAAPRLDARTGRQQAQVRLEILKRAALTLQGEIAGAQAGVARLRQELERARVRAPVDGVIGEVLALTPGAWVPKARSWPPSCRTATCA